MPVHMDSRLRGNDNGVSGNDSVIPAKAGIHADATEKSKENVYNYLRWLKNLKQ